MASTFYLSAGVYPQELDLSGQVAAISSSIGATVFASHQGPTILTNITSIQGFKDTYGLPDASLSYGHYTALAFLQVANNMWCRRVVNGDATYAGAVVTNSTNAGISGESHIIPFDTGRYVDYSASLNNYSAGEQQFQTIHFSTALVTLNSISSFTITDGITPATITATTFATSNDNTLALLKAKIITALSTFTPIGAGGLNGATGNPGSCDIILQDATGNNARSLYIVSPQGKLLTISPITVTLGTTQPTVTVNTNPWLFEVYAENPGAWGNNIGLAIRNADFIGTPQQITFNFSAPPVSGQSFSTSFVTPNGTFIVGPVAFVTSAAATVTAIGAAVTTVVPNAVVTTNLASNGTTVLGFTLTAPIGLPAYFTVTAASFTGTGTLPTVTYQETLSGITPLNSFELWVYSNANISAPKYKYIVSFNQQTDGFGNQEFIESVVNATDGSSPWIRVNYNINNTAGVIDGLSLLESQNPVWLNGGNDGSIPTNSQIVLGWQDFSDRATVAVRILLNAGYTSPLVQQYMDSLAQSRYDCFAILDMPSLLQDATDAVNYRNNMNVDSSYSGIYTPDLQITDPYSNQTLFVPPSGYVGAVFANTDAVAAAWFAPAGLNRALVKNVLGLRYLYDSGDQNNLSANQINYILKMPGKGYPVMNASTLQAKASALSNINVRRLLIVIEVSLVDALDYTLFEPDDPYTQFQVTQLCTNFLQPIKEGRGLIAYQVICNATNNQPYYADMGQLNCDLLLKPTIPVKFIRLTSVITSQGAAFAETIALLNAA